MYRTTRRVSLLTAVLLTVTMLGATGCHGAGHRATASRVPATTPASASMSATARRADLTRLQFRQVLVEDDATATAGQSGTTSTSAGACQAINTWPDGCLTTALIAQFLRTTCGVPTTTALDPDRATVACSRDGKTRYILAPAMLSGLDVASAEAEFSSTQGNIVNFDFNAHGARVFADATAQVTSLIPPLNQIAAVYDGTVMVAPRIDSAITGGMAEIYGEGLTAAQTQQIASLFTDVGHH